MKDKRFYYKNNRLQQLRGFCYTAQFENMSKAANFMGLLPSTISLQIKSLEHDMGVTLFFRNGPHIKLTREGQIVYELALPFLEGIDGLFDQFKIAQDIQNNSELRISANSTSKSFLLPPVITRYIQEHPGVKMTLHDAEHDKAIELLQENIIDCAALPFRSHKIIPKGILYIPVYFFKSYLITRADHPLAGRKMLSVDEISQYNLILPDEDLRVISNLYDIFREKISNFQTSLQFVGGETGRAYIEQGLMITISTNVWIKDQGDILTATPIDHLCPDADYGFFVREGEENSKLIKTLIDLSRSDAISRNQNKSND